MASTVTVTGVVGPAKTITAQVLSNVTAFDIDCVAQKLIVSQSGQLSYFDINGKTTITVTVSGGNYTVSVA